MSYNFSPISSRDSIAFACSRPGFAKDNESPGAVKDEDIKGWCEFIHSKGVKHIVSLLGDDEALWYATPIDQLLEKNGFELSKYTRTSVFVDGAAEKIINGFKHADECNEPFVVHCSGGAGRASVGAALWLMHKYNLSAEEAGEEIVKAATDGVNRKPSAEKAERLFKTGTLKK
ncbi:hypothetical protein SARC_09680 [Sphaeroforma arctica JP610]|uniref:Tyrosine specific protein phosphatases domain-containing protein n=1 Tax=Sphaeroforma arctica JP610 TaxID=667725 RepID=A0A0L0FM85_9EUKA|nr:hypothetical protein SARC_09680 [Sphaeroforma arctica JP610]KNC77870.1 hypothetical protein SARC_09680 [Sphaeroforma arctica JP610]|eukprot:XP_014151772.1 hypothetical protein SARC_09680 [Sphaeroforma arctica JP610]